MKTMGYGHQWIDGDDIAEVVRVLRGDWLSQGPTVEAFEKVLADYAGVRHAVAYANGTEPSDLTSRHRKSRGFSNEITISHDLVDREEARLILLSLCETLAARIRLQGDKIRLVGVYYKDSSFVSASRQTRLNRSSSSTQTIYETALSLLHELWDGRPLRLLGVRGSEIDKDSDSYQMDLFDAGKNRKLDQLDAAVDQIRDKFGDSSIRRAVFLGADETDLKKRRSNRSRKKPEDPTEPETPCC